MYSVTLIHTQTPESSTYLQSQFLVFNEADIAVSAQLEVGPLLVDHLRLSIYCLLHLLRLLVGLYHPPRPDSLGVAKLVRTTLQNVKDCGDVV